MESLLATLLGSLTRELPGVKAQWRMAPAGRKVPTPHEVQGHVRLGGVLALLYPHHGEPHIALTRRTETVAHHRGQISLPGGAREGCEAMVATALREAHEEIGLGLEQVEVIGALTPLFIPASGFSVHPFVGWSVARPDFVVDEKEVDVLMEVPLVRLEDPRHVRRQMRVIRGREIMVPYYDIEGGEVWGATAMILAELLALLE